METKPDSRNKLLDDLQTSQRTLSAVLAKVVDDQDWRPAPGEWSFRELAAHLAVVEKDCHLVRIERIVAGEKPYFDYYLNSQEDFDDQDLSEFLSLWETRREELSAFVRSLAPEQVLLSGTHVTFGQLTVLGVLNLMLDHDRVHLAELQAQLVAFRGEI